MVTFYQKEKKQKFLLIVFFGVVLITILILYFGLKRPSAHVSIEEEISSKTIEIDFSVLKNPILKELESYEKIEPVEPEKVGRENPFSPLLK